VAFAPWLLLVQRREQFLYYLLPAVPFMCLALAEVLMQIRGRWRPLILAVSFGAIIGSFAFFYPLLTAVPLSRSAWEARILFRDCALYPVEPLREPVPPPSGWCWA